MSVKKMLFNLLIGILNKLDADKLKSCSFGDKIEIETKRYIPDDNKWHKATYTTSFWIMVGENPKKTEDIYVDDFQAQEVK